MAPNQSPSSASLLPLGRPRGRRLARALVAAAVLAEPSFAVPRRSRLCAGKSAACDSGAMRVYARDMKTICYCAAVRSAARKTTALYDSILESSGVTLAQYSLLRKIERAGTVSLTRLGRIAELDRSTVGRNVKALEQLRLVRTAPAEDRREAAVRLAPAGEE